MQTKESCAQVPVMEQHQSSSAKDARANPVVRAKVLQQHQSVHEQQAREAVSDILAADFPPDD